MSRRGGDGLVVMEANHEEDPVATGEVVNSQVHRVGANDCRYDKQVDNDHNRGCQQDDEADKHLEHSDKSEGPVIKVVPVQGEEIK